MSTSLTPTQHLVLTTVAWRGPCTAYDLKDYFQRIVSVMAPVPHTLLYTELPKLAAAGLLDETREEGGRRRRTYAVTEAGTAIVRAWLATPPARDPVVDDEALIKLAYSALSTPAAVRAIARHQIEYHESRLAWLEEGLAASAHDARRRRYLRSGARLAVEQTRVLLEFWRDVEHDPDRKAEAATVRSG